MTVANHHDDLITDGCHCPGAVDEERDPGESDERLRSLIAQAVPFSRSYDDTKAPRAHGAVPPRPKPPPDAPKARQSGSHCAGYCPVGRSSGRQGEANQAGSAVLGRLGLLRQHGVDESLGLLVGLLDGR
jgi:hypothetical protein